MSNSHDGSSTVPSARDVLRDMWATRRTEAEADGLALLSALESLVASPTDAEVRSRAQHRAHQLAGIFGVFGFAELKTQMARIDIELSDVSVPVADLLDRAQDILADLP